MKLLVRVLAVLAWLFGTALGTTIFPADLKVKPKFREQGSDETHGDTLQITIWSLDSSNYFYYPFGEYSDKSVLKKSILTWLPKLVVVANSGREEYVFSNSARDSIRFVYTARSEAKRFEIAYAKIISRVQASRLEIQIGMGKRLFLHSFFSVYPAAWNKFKVIEIITGPLDDRFGNQTKETIKHYYTFRNNRLSGIVIISQYTAD
jgi:hypothetical protein